MTTCQTAPSSYKIIAEQREELPQRDELPCRQLTYRNTHVAID